MNPPTIRLAVMCDYAEERWPSMDLCADMLLRELQASNVGIAATRLSPKFHRRLTRVDVGLGSWTLRNADRLLNRFWDYPRHVKPMGDRFDLFHVVDHSYAHLVHALPAQRTGVYCHDLDAFRCLLAPHLEPRPAWFRAMMRRVLSGLRKAAVVFYSTAAVREQIERVSLVAPERLVAAPYGVAPEFTRATTSVLPGQVRSPYLLHVGSCIPRKRIDLLLEAFAAARNERPELMLVQVGGDFTSEQRSELQRLGIAAATVQLRNLATPTLAGLYRHAELVLQPSDAEGFGLPVAEALACGAPVVASNLAALREVGGDAALYVPPGDRAAWIAVTRSVLRGATTLPPLDRRVAQASRFSWEAHARTIAAAYRRIAEAGPRLSSGRASRSLSTESSWAH